ncbi:hypothetical protein [Bacillus cereus]|uniref:hypothetical protein n=1 Tax=Bacillus cereus TaxID=1396 RepID=UPI003D2F59BE
MDKDKNTKGFIEPFTWTAFAAAIAVGVITELASDYIKRNFLNNTVNYEMMFKQAIEEICTYIDQKVDEAFLREYLSGCNYVRQQLNFYARNNDHSIIPTLQKDAAQLVQNFKGFDVQGFGGLVVACNLHLLILKALSELPEKESWKITFEDTCKEYADWIEKGLEQYIILFKNEYKIKNFRRVLIGPQGDLSSLVTLFHKDKRLKTCMYGGQQECFAEMDAITNEITENAPNEHIPYIKCKEMIKNYREFTTPSTNNS